MQIHFCSGFMAVMLHNVSGLMEAITHGEGRVIFNRRAPRRSDVNNVPHVKAERGKETQYGIQQF